MAKVLIIGAGGVGNVVAKKCAQAPRYLRISFWPAGRKRNAIRLRQIDRPSVTTGDADHAEEVIP